MDNITVEEVQAATQGTGMTILHKLCQAIWEQEKLPSDWKRSVIIPIPKKKDKLDCSNYRGISLLCHSSKVFSSILLRRIKNRTEEILSEAQAGFRANRSTIDQIFVLRQLAEQYEEFGRELYVCYIDFKKAFDSVWRKGLWRVMRHYGYPEKIIRILEEMYNETFSAVRVDGELSDWFVTIVGVLQGCVLSPLLFNIFLEIIIATALDESDAGAMVNGEIFSNLRFADDIAVMAEGESDLQMAVDKIVDVSSSMGMCINAAKTEIQFLGKGNITFQIKVNEQQLQQTENFVYLGGNISTNDGSGKDIERRIGLARGMLQTLNRIWTSKELSKQTKMRVYETLVKSVLLYNSETWTLKEKDKARLRVFEMTCLRKIEGVTRRDRIRNEEIRGRLHVQQDIVGDIAKRRLRYFGHISRMDDGRYPKIAFNGYVHGQRRRGRPKKRWIDVVRADCNYMGMTVNSAARNSSDRDGWRKSIEELLMRALASPRQ